MLRGRRWLHLRWLLACALCAALPAAAQDRGVLGVATMFNNDYFGDGADRWQTGSYQISVFTGPSGALRGGTRPLEVLEFRLRGDIRAPGNLVNPSPADRIYAGSWWLGLHTHWARAGVELAFGADLVVTGEQSGLRAFQDAVHSRLGFPPVNVLKFQIEDRTLAHVTLEAGITERIGPAAVRPFVEVQAGAETLVRAGVDLTIGAWTGAGLFTRDPITGHRVAVGAGRPGWAAVAGVDVAYVQSSIFFPGDRGPALDPTRARFRAGLARSTARSSVFLGLTYLSEEFLGQDEGQVVGSFNVSVRF